MRRTKFRGISQIIASLTTPINVSVSISKFKYYNLGIEHFAYRIKCILDVEDDSYTKLALPLI